MFSIINKSLMKSLTVSLGLTAVSYFLGWLRFPGIIFLQLLRIFLITFIVFFICYVSLAYISLYWKKQKGK